MSKGIIVTKSVKGNSNEAIMQLRGGEKGTGQVYHSVRYWPQSGRSVDAAYDHIFAAAERQGVEIVPAADREDW